MSEVFTMIKTAASSASVVAAGIKTVSGSFQELKLACNVSWFQNTKAKLDGLNNKLISSETEVQKLKQDIDSLGHTITFLKATISTEFPELKRLILSYSEMRKDVAVEGAIANKAGEIIKLRQDIAYIYIMPLTVVSRSGHTRILVNIKTLPSIDTEVVGVINEKLSRIENLIRDLERINTPRSVSQETGVDIEGIAEIFQQVSESYAGIEAKLSELLNRKILQNFDPKF